VITHGSVSSPGKPSFSPNIASPYPPTHFDWMKIKFIFSGLHSTGESPANDWRKSTSSASTKPRNLTVLHPPRPHQRRTPPKKMKRNHVIWRAMKAASVDAANEHLNAMRDFRKGKSDLRRCTVCHANNDQHKMRYQLLSCGSTVCRISGGDCKWRGRIRSCQSSAFTIIDESGGHVTTVTIPEKNKFTRALRAQTIALAAQDMKPSRIRDHLVENLNLTEDEIPLSRQFRTASSIIGAAISATTTTLTQLSILRSGTGIHHRLRRARLSLLDTTRTRMGTLFLATGPTPSRF
jgi:hypothetical protein